MRLFNNFASKLYSPEDNNSGTGDNKDTNVDDKNKSTKIKIGGTDWEEADLSSAASLYKALQDPETGLEIIETLAKRAGLLDKEGKVKIKEGETKKQAESRAANKLKAKLGKDYDKFADSIGPALDELISEAMEELRGESQAVTTQDKWNSAVETFVGNHETTDKIEEAMKELIDEAPPNFKSKNFDSQKYLSRIYKAACDELEVEPKEKSSRSRGSSRKKSDDDFSDIVERDAPKGASLDDAIEAAMRGIRYKKK